jgi:hypothetical protein
MPTRKEWEVVHADLMARLHLPCKLRFSTKVKIGQHEARDDGSCRITVNPEVDFRVPEHLILHEAAHHRAYDIDAWHGHDELWANVLCDIYRETGVPLPQTTSFFAFAKAAGIERKNFAEEQ